MNPRYSRRLAEVEEDITALQGDLKSIRLEWENAYDKLRAMMGRVSKRSAMMEAHAEEDGAGPEASESASSHLSPTQAAVMREIQLRRSRA